MVIISSGALFDILSCKRLRREKALSASEGHLFFRRQFLVLLVLFVDLDHTRMLKNEMSVGDGHMLYCSSFVFCMRWSMHGHQLYGIVLATTMRSPN